MGKWSFQTEWWDDEEIVPPLKDVVRVATEEDYETHLKNIEKAKEHTASALTRLTSTGLQ